MGSAVRHDPLQADPEIQALGRQRCGIRPSPPGDNGAPSMRAASIVRTAKDLACWSVALILLAAANGNPQAQAFVVLTALAAILVIGLTMRT
jgi:hypothetical protein